VFANDQIAGTPTPSAAKPTLRFGRLMSEGEDITLRSAEARSFGMVFQGYALFPHMTSRRTSPSRSK
jgi:ABC-type Fe3+/spermidine/putrescine transport system ATPase subunit